jgi:hypothetical protein
MVNTSSFNLPRKDDHVKDRAAQNADKVISLPEVQDGGKDRGGQRKKPSLKVFPESAAKRVKRKHCHCHRGRYPLDKVKEDADAFSAPDAFAGKKQEGQGAAEDDHRPHRQNHAQSLGGAVHVGVLSLSMAFAPHLDKTYGRKENNISHYKAE